MIKNKNFFYILVGIILFIFYLFYKIFLINYLDYPVNEFNLKIEKGENFQTILPKICSIKKLNWLECKILYFQAINSITGLNNIKPGSYNFSGTNLKSVFKKIVIGPNIQYISFTIYPGDTKFDISKRILSGYERVYNKLDPIAYKISKRFLNLIDDKDFITKLKSNYNFLNQFGLINSLEGFLYPETYFFKKEDFKSVLLADLLIKTAIKQFEKKSFSLFENCKDNTNCNPYKLTNYEILIIASIVEKEERTKRNKPLIADILIRRYKKGMFIGADWTLCYGLKINSFDCKKYLSNEYLKDNTNPYNTRAVKGLPPTPVGNPTVESIKAVLYPIKNDYWYYLHDCDGNIYFGKTYEQHLINKNKYVCEP